MTEKLIDNRTEMDIQDDISKHNTQIYALLTMMSLDGIVEEMNTELVRSTIWIARDLATSITKDNELLWSKLYRNQIRDQARVGEAEKS